MMLLPSRQSTPQSTVIINYMISIQIAFLRLFRMCTDNRPIGTKCHIDEAECENKTLKIIWNRSNLKSMLSFTSFHCSLVRNGSSLMHFNSVGEWKPFVITFNCSGKQCAHFIGVLTWDEKQNEIRVKLIHTKRRHKIGGTEPVKEGRKL